MFLGVLGRIRCEAAYKGSQVLRVFVSDYFSW